MKFLQIPKRLIEEKPDLYELIWPGADVNEVYGIEGEPFNEFILRGEVYMVPETHPNVTFIMLRIHEHHWYDDETGPYRFIRYV